jgi:hypothetical protein
LSYDEVLGKVKILRKRKERIRVLYNTEIKIIKASVKTGKAACEFCKEKMFWLNADDKFKDSNGDVFRIKLGNYPLIAFKYLKPS